MNFRFILEMIGTVAFAFSGAMVAVNKKMDIFGVAILGMTTAVGGGIVRDLILDVAPPAAFRMPVYAVTAIAVSILAFSRSVRAMIHNREKAADEVMLLMDSVGLGVFTVVGIEKAFELYPEKNIFLALFVGVVTGVGGGVMRDLFAGDQPSIFVKHFYATASIIGAIVCVGLWHVAGSELALAVGAITVTVLRLLAARYHWNLPKAG